MAILYEDEYLSCDNDGVTIHAYYFPWGSKRIFYRDIVGIKEQPMTFLTGGSRIWGGSWEYWLHFDPQRPWKDRLIIIDENQTTKPIITPQNHDRVWDILSDQVPIDLALGL